MKRLLVLAAVIVLAGCGEGGGGGAVVEANISVTDAKEYVSSVRDPKEGWIVTTTGFKFATYTSLKARVGSPVTVKRYVDPATALTLGNLLMAGEDAILIKKTLAP